MNNAIHERKKVKLNFLTISVLILFCLLLGVLSNHKRPYGNIEASDLRAIKFHSDFYGNIDGESLDDADVEKCVQLLNAIKNFKRLPAHLTIYDLPMGYHEDGFDLEFQDGNLFSIYINGSEFMIENQRFEANERDTVEFELFFNTMVLKYFPEHDQKGYFEQNIKDAQEWLSSDENKTTGVHSRWFRLLLFLYFVIIQKFLPMPLRLFL